MKILMIGHLLGDFYFQTDRMAENKKESLGYTTRHCLIYSIVMYVVLTVATGELIKYILPVLLIGALHLLTDGIKCVFYKKCKLEKYELSVFVIDQFIHIAILWMISCMCTIVPNIDWMPGISESLENNMKNSAFIFNAFLLCGKPAAVIVSLVFGLIPKTIEKAEIHDTIATENNKRENIKIGSWIGILEREIILILGLLGEYGAIGFVVAAKSLARHKQLDNPAFAEKYLIGTLLSSLIALLSIIVCSLGIEKG